MTSLAVSAQLTSAYVFTTPLLLKHGTSCSKLTMLLVNDALKFQMAILQIHCYSLLKKMLESFPMQRILTFFQQKNNSVFAFEVYI